MLDASGTSRLTIADPNRTEQRLNFLVFPRMPLPDLFKKGSADRATIAKLL